jgi:GNAT superfamily N-acetyltransferase
MTQVSVSLASDPEARACLALLPEVRGAPVELLIARLDGELAGAAAVYWQNWTTPAGFPTQIHVVPGARRRGVGRALLAEDDEAAGFLRAGGFRPARRQHYFEAALTDLLAEVAPRAARLRSRGRSPDGLAIIPLTKAPLAPLARIVAFGFGNGPDSMVRGLEARLTRPDDRSLVLMVGEAIAGAVLWRIDKDLAMIEARVVAEGFRGGWLNTLLLEAGLLEGQAEGVRRMRFDCHGENRDTLNLARRCAAVEIANRANWYYSIGDRG